MDNLEHILLETATAWENWLEENHQSIPGIWLKIAKKASHKVSVSMPAAIDLALCFGWIDSQRLKCDDDFYLQRFTPRRKKSNWSQINIEKAEMLIQSGQMREAGMQEIEMAKADGRWANN